MGIVPSPEVIAAVAAQITVALRAINDLLFGQVPQCTVRDCIVGLKHRCCGKRIARSARALVLDRIYLAVCAPVIAYRISRSKLLKHVLSLSRPLSSFDCHVSEAKHVLVFLTGPVRHIIVSVNGGGLILVELLDLLMNEFKVLFPGLELLDGGVLLVELDNVAHELEVDFFEGRNHAC